MEVWPHGSLARKEWLEMEAAALDKQSEPIEAAASACDDELVSRAQRGDEAAFEALFHAHKKRIYYLFLRMMGNKADAEDLTQEAFLQVFRKIHTFRGESAFSTWLHRLAVNLVLMRLRKKRVKEISVESEPEDEMLDRPKKEFGAPDLSLAGLPDRLALKEAVAKLPPGYKQVFMMHDVLGCGHHEIAATLGYSIGNSKSQLHKARMRLRKLLGKGFWKKTRGTKIYSLPGFGQSFPSNPASEG